MSGGREDITEATVPTPAATQSSLDHAGKRDIKETVRDPGRPSVGPGPFTGTATRLSPGKRPAETTATEFSMTLVASETKDEKVGLDPMDGSPLSGWGDTVCALIECTCACCV